MLGIHHQRGLGDLELDTGRRHAVLLEHRAAVRDEARLAEFLEREIDRDAARIVHLPAPLGVVAADVIEYPGTDFQDQARFLRERDELGRCDLAVARQSPAQQRFRTHHLVGEKIHLRLVAQQELVAFQCPSQLALQQQTFHRRGVHRRRVEDVAVSPGALRVIHRGVGAADEVDDVVGILRAGRDADARRHVDLVLAHVQFTRHLLEQQPGDRLRLLMPGGRAVGCLEERGKLVAGQPPHDRLLGQRPDQPFAQRLEHAVAGGMSEGVVDLLEVVHVHVQQREPARPAPAARDRLL